LPQFKTSVFVPDKVTKTHLFIPFQTPKALRNDGFQVQPHGLFSFDSFDLRHRLRLRSSDPLGVHNEQHDSADERERSDNRRDKMADSGLKVHSKEFDRLSRSREGDARVSEHHDAQSDQEDGDNGFCIHIDSFSLFSSVGSFLIQPPAPGDEADEHHDNGNRQQDVDEPAQRVTAYETERPQNEQYYRNCV
jgi:hypothetical protein